MTAMSKPKVPASQPAPVGAGQVPLAMPLLRPTLAPRTTQREERVPTKPALVARDFKFGYRAGETVLKGISFEIPHRAVTARFSNAINFGLGTLA